MSGEQEAPVDSLANGRSSTATTKTGPPEDGTPSPSLHAMATAGQDDGKVDQNPTSRAPQEETQDSETAVKKANPDDETGPSESSAGIQDQTKGAAGPAVDPAVKNTKSEITPSVSQRDISHPPAGGKQAAETSGGGRRGGGSAAAATVEDNPALSTPLPPVGRSILARISSRRNRIPDEELKSKCVLPVYLSKGMADAIQSQGVVYSDRPPTESSVAPENPILVFINSKSGGRLGPQLESLLVNLLSPTQVYDLSKCKPVDVFRHGLGHLEKQADAGDKTALACRNNLRILVAGGDGTIGWVLGSVAALQGGDRFQIPPVAIIPLGTGNDLSRSFKWGAATTSINKRRIKRCLKKVSEAESKTLDSWQVIVRPAPTRLESPLKLPHAMAPQHHIPLQDTAGGTAESKVTSSFSGYFWNYFSLGMDAQVAYGFHNLRDEAPWLASGRVSNQVVYGGYSCVQGWFCTPCAAGPVHRGLRRIAQVSIKKGAQIEAQWEPLPLPSGVRAIVILNLQSYAGGRHPWGRPSSRQLEKDGLVEAKYNDGVLEILGFRDGWHTAFVLLDIFTAVRLGQARAVKLELTGNEDRETAYMQMDGEPWQQFLGSEEEPPAVVEITCNPVQSRVLLRK